MWSLIFSSIAISTLHGLLPNHWLPIIAIGKKESWSKSKVLTITFYSAVAHSASTIIIGLIIAFLGQKLSEEMEHFSHLFAPVLLIALGLFFIYQHYRHRHFHLHNVNKIKDKKSDVKLISALVVAMFFSPCLEIEAVYLAAGSYGFTAILIISIIYFVISVLGMLLWVRISYFGLEKLNWHRLEHNSGIISGIILILTGISMFFLH